MTTDASVPTENPGEPDWAEARRLFEVEGLSLREIAERVGASHEGVRGHRDREGWARLDGAVAARDAERAQQAQAAVAGAQRKWAARREQEADAAGITAALARQRIVQAMNEADWHMTRSASIAYGILIDKAQILSGGPTARIEEIPIEERLARVMDARERLRAVRDTAAA